MTSPRPPDTERAALVATVAYVLRASVGSIHAAADLLVSADAPSHGDGHDGLVDDIRSESGRLVRLLEDLLMLARLEDGGPAQQEPVLLERVVPASVERARGKQASLDVEYTVEAGLPMVSGLETCIEEILADLILGAGGHGEGCVVQVAVVSDGSGDAVVIRVLDRCHGGKTSVAPDALGKQGPVENIAGTDEMALRLMACRHLTEALGGELWTEPAAQGHIDLRVRLPAFEDAGPASG